MTEEQNAAAAAAATPEAPAAPAAEPAAPDAVAPAVAQAIQNMQGQKLDLAPCPDGSVPENLLLEMNRNNPKVGIARGDSCPDWGVEFLIVNPNDQERLVRDAAAAWNNAPRG